MGTSYLAGYKLNLELASEVVSETVWKDQALNLWDLMIYLQVDNVRTEMHCKMPVSVS